MRNDNEINRKSCQQSVVVDGAVYSLILLIEFQDYGMAQVTSVEFSLFCYCNPLTPLYRLICHASHYSMVVGRLSNYSTVIVIGQNLLLYAHWRHVAACNPSLYTYMIYH